MESDVKARLYRDLKEWGYPLLEPAETVEPGDLLKELVQQDDVRLLEGFPVVLSTWLMHQKPAPFLNLVVLEDNLASAATKKRFRLLTAITWYLISMIPESSKCRKELYEYIDTSDPNLLNEVPFSFTKDKQFNLGTVKLSPQRLQTTFSNYVVSSRQQKAERLSEQMERTREIAFNESLAELFSDRQAEIVRKILAQQTLTKTEREYYSRVIKKRMAAIANKDLQVLAASLLGKQDVFIRSELLSTEDS